MATLIGFSSVAAAEIEVTNDECVGGGGTAQPAASGILTCFNGRWDGAFVI